MLLLLSLLSACDVDSDDDISLSEPCTTEGEHVCEDDPEGGECCHTCMDGAWVVDPPMDTGDPDSNCPMF